MHIQRSFPPFLFLLFAGASGFAFAGPDPRQVFIQSIAYGGTGCPQGSVATSLADDRKSMTLIFDKFVASAGPGIPVTEERKNCQVNVNLHIPNGWSFTIATFDYRGYVQLPAGMTAAQKALYYFGGDRAQGASETLFTGPVALDYLVRDTLGVESLVWSNCNATKPLNIHASVSIDRGSSAGSGQITTDSIGGKVSTVLGIFWQPC